MRLGKIVLALPVAGLFMWLGASAASAQVGPIRGQVHLAGRISPTHYVIVSSKGVILEIVSNTYQDTDPLVFKHELTAAAQIPLSQSVYNQYLKLVPAGTSHPGVLYHRSISSTAKTVPIPPPPAASPLQTLELNSLS